MDVLRSTPASRIVAVSSAAHIFGRMDWANLNAETSHDRSRASSQGKLANLLVTFELQRRLDAAGWDLKALAAHPGWTGTDLQRHASLVRFLNLFFAQTPVQGAWPILMAALVPEATGGDHCGPRSFWEMRGSPVWVGATDAVKYVADAVRLWETSEWMTGSTFALGQHQPQVAGSTMRISSQRFRRFSRSVPSWARPGTTPR